MRASSEVAKSIHWRVNCFCNRKCPFCYGPEKHHEVRLEESLPVLEKMLVFGIDTFILTGGEPLLSAKIDKVIAFLHSHSAKVVLYTNCDFFDLHEDLLVECLDTICVPIEGASEYVHDMVRGENNLRAVISVLDRYANGVGKFKVKVGTVIGRHNISELSAIAYLLGKYKLTVWKLYEYIRYTDRTLQRLWDQNQLGITPAEYRSAAQTVMSMSTRKTPVALSSGYDRDNSYFMMNPDLEMVVPMRGEGGCYEDKVICSAKECTMAEIEDRWRTTIDWDSYTTNLRVSLF
jgi:MoaA/NifB/PqqE/SkfB family radical SAM enzyme